MVLVVTGSAWREEPEPDGEFALRAARSPPCAKLPATLPAGTCISVYIYAYVYVYLHVYVYRHIYIDIFIDLCICLFIFVYMYRWLFL